MAYNYKHIDTDLEKEYIIAAALETEEGKIALAEAWCNENTNWREFLKNIKRKPTIKFYGFSQFLKTEDE